MKIIYIAMFILLVLTIALILKIHNLKNVEYHQPSILTNKKILTVYFSNSGNTEKVAKIINSVVGGDIKQIQLKEKYPNNVFQMSKIVKKQIKEGYLPKTDEIDISNYDVIFAGSPIWNFSASLPFKSFLKSNSFENKILIPFFTYSGGASKKELIKEAEDLTNKKDIIKPLLLFQNGIFLAKEQIIDWLNKI